MSRALVTFGVGSHREMLDIALPSFRAYADRHGYELVVCDETRCGSLTIPRAATPAVIPVRRPWSWMKIPAMTLTLFDYEEVLWLDADVIVVDDMIDIASRVPDDAWQGIAEHRSSTDGDHPNHGVWLARRPMIPTLGRIWRMTEYMHHPWWEQAASLELLGYDPNERPVRARQRTELRERTMLLDEEWNALPEVDVAHPRFRHAASRPNRIQLMKGWADAAAVC